MADSTRPRPAYNRKLSTWAPLIAFVTGAVAMSTVQVANAAEATGAPDPSVPDEAEVCLSCHGYLPDEPPLEGPSLWQVIGRPVASVEGFEYSDALSGIRAVWDRALLDRFLTDPQAFAPGTRMDMGGVRNPEDRAAVLDFLESLQPR